MVDKRIYVHNGIMVDLSDYEVELVNAVFWEMQIHFSEMGSNAPKIQYYYENKQCFIERPAPDITGFIGLVVSQKLEERELVNRAIEQEFFSDSN